MPRDHALFLGQFLRNPSEISAIAPSSPSVAQKMTEGLEKVRGPIVEIGAGTGTFTRAILDRGVEPSRLTLIELNPRFCEALAERFPGVRVINRPAQDIALLGLRDLGAVISGVPVLARPQVQRQVVGAAFRVMAPGGVFVQITYAASSPIPEEMLDELGLVSVRRGTVWTNLPPARVFEFRAVQH